MGGGHFVQPLPVDVVWMKRFFFFNDVHGSHQYGEHVLRQLHRFGEITAPVD